MSDKEIAMQLTMKILEIDGGKHILFGRGNDCDNESCENAEFFANQVNTVFNKIYRNISSSKTETLNNI